MRITLDCPLCGERVADGVDALAPGRCPGCGARYEGDGEHPVAGVEAALAAFGAHDLPAEEVTTALFSIEPGRATAGGVGVASDSRDGFYRWWVFARDDRRDPGALLRSLAAGLETRDRRR